jgi:membrane associated rhomboid family serine protease
MRRARKHGLSVLGMAAACVACCASPILAIIGGLGLAGLASTLLVGATGLVIAVAIAALLVVGRRRKDCLVADDSPAPVAAPTRRTADLSRSAQ